jgi:magnesium transporter
VVFGVVGIVAFGTINSGLSSETDVDHITYLWRRGGWLGFFFTMAFALIVLLIFTSSLDAILAARSDLSSVPFSGMSAREGPKSHPTGYWRKARAAWNAVMMWIMEKLETWSAPKDDKTVAWTLGIGWACCGGGLAGGCLVFAKARWALLAFMIILFPPHLLTSLQRQTDIRKSIP